MSKKAPGKSNRKGTTIIELIQMFPDEETATEWFEIKRWGNDHENLYCPLCGGMDKVKKNKNRDTLPFHCGDCRRHFSVKTNSVMHRSKIPLQKWAIAFYLYSSNLKGVSSMKLHRDLGITQKSAWFMGHRIREAMKGKGGVFEGPVEIDETYVGGKEKNKHSKKKLRAGRGGVGKSVVVGIKDRKTNNIKADVVEDTKKETLHDFVNENVEDAAHKYTDEHGAYKGLRNHRSVNHSIGHWVDEMAHTNGIESFWAMFKKGFHGTHHKMSHKHLHRYVNEFAERHNLRPLDTLIQMERLANNGNGKRLMYRDLIK